jgi:hypothetical protein
MTKDATSGIPLADLRKKAQEEAPKGQFDTFLEEVAQGRKDLAEQRKEDKNMALLAAGLGMLGGSSQYAFENIGKGGLSGVQYLSEANKQRAAEKAALDKSQVTALRYKDLKDIAKADKEGTLAFRQLAYEEGVEKNALAKIAEINKNIELQAEKNVKAMKGVDEILDPAKLAQLQNAEIARLKSENQPLFDKLYKKAGLEMPTLSSKPTSALQAQADAILKGK